MKRQFILTCICLLFTFVGTQGKTTSIPTIYIDGNGVMRWSDTHREASFFGANYTTPFAHAYRALGYLGVDRKAAIDKDVYHLSRLGFNAYRIHLWDVELTDGEGNLSENDHLDLMDYLIAKLKERNIHIVITAQTNFGNGYPERNEPTGGFSYKYDKCSMHSEPEAIAAQERYLYSLVRHTNPYTGLAYKDDPSIVGFEINNEPCHSGTKEEVKAYINRMLKAIRKAGNRKPVFYNVSHNEWTVEAYYDTDIKGTTYQWYPIGLVSGQTQQGNFLPYVDRYDISFADKVKGFDKKARMIYEFDPADIMYSYMYPAMVRTFRTAGFQWITQFAYDPMDIAYANTEYQTHFLNLAYTPHKAISMKIASEAAQSLKRGASYGSYPWTADSQWNTIRLGEYAAPAPRATSYRVMHTPATTVEANKPLKITAQITGPEFPDSVIIYTDKISFWNDHNPSVKMQRTNGYTYQATIPAEEIKEGYFRYNIIVCRGDSTRTYPAGSSATGSSSGTNGNPLDWDYTLSQYWTTRVVAPGSAIQLLTVTDTHSRIEAYTLPEWNELHRSLTDSSPTEKPLLRFTFTSKGENPQYFLRTFVKDKIDGRKGKIKDCTVLCIRVNRAKALPEGISAGFVTSDGYTYKSPCPSPSPEGIIRIPLNRLRQTDTALLPVAYPVFLKQYFQPETEIPFQAEKIEKLEISMPGNARPVTEIELGEIWLE